jgi:hypothetical protein
MELFTATAVRISNLASLLFPLLLFHITVKSLDLRIQKLRTEAESCGLV